MQHPKKEKGITLVEVILYLGLFALLVGGNLGSIYSIIESTNRNQAKSFMYEEGNFLLAKIDWALSGIQTVNTPVAGSDGSLLSVNKWDPAIGSVQVQETSGNMILTKNGNVNILNNTNVVVSDLLFSHQLDGNIEYVRAQFTLTGITPNGATINSHFETTKYLRR